MKRILFFLAVVFLNPTAEASTHSEAWVRDLKSLESSHDFLKLRVKIRSQLGKIIKGKSFSGGDLLSLKAFMYSTPEIGADLIYQFGLIEGAAGSIRKSNNHKRLDRADRLMLKRRFSKAAVEYERAATELNQLLKKTKKSNDSHDDWLQLRQVYPYVLHDLARALYGAGRYKDSLKIYNWIPVSYPRLRIVLLEKMWAAIRSKNPHVALGAWYSIRSGYFSSFAYPEEFLVAIYALQALCLDKEATALFQEMKRYNFNKIKKKQLFLDWVKTDYETLSLWNLVQGRKSQYVRSKVLVKERKKIYAFLKKSFSEEYKQIIKSFQKMKAIGFLAQLPETQDKIKGLSPLKSHADYSALGEEIWYGNNGEFWVDELSSNVYLGESQCSKRR